MKLKRVISRFRLFFSKKNDKEQATNMVDFSEAPAIIFSKLFRRNYRRANEK